MMKTLNFHGTQPRCRARMRRRTWFAVFGAEQIQQNQKIFPGELEERLVKLYSDIEMNDVFEPLSNYVAMRDENNT